MTKCEQKKKGNREPSAVFLGWACLCLSSCSFYIFIPCILKKIINLWSLPSSGQIETITQQGVRLPLPVPLAARTNKHKYLTIRYFKRHPVPIYDTSLCSLTVLVNFYVPSGSGVGFNNNNNNSMHYRLPWVSHKKSAHAHTCTQKVEMRKKYQKIENQFRSPCQDV